MCLFDLSIYFTYMYLKGINMSRCQIMFISLWNMFISVSNHVYFCLKSCLFLYEIMLIYVWNHVYFCVNHVYSCVNSCLFLCEMMFISFRSLTVIICILFNQDLLCHCFEVTPRFFYYWNTPLCFLWIYYSNWYWNKFEDTKGVIRSHKSKKDNQHNGQQKKDNNDLQNIR